MSIQPQALLDILEGQLEADKEVFGEAIMTGDGPADVFDGVCRRCRGPAIAGE